MKPNLTQNLKSIILALILVAGVASVSAYGTWTNPTANPPLNNTDTPINVGELTQTKLGALQTLGLGVTGDFKFLPTTLTPPTAGQVLMADETNLALGKVKWGTVAGGGSGTTGGGGNQLPPGYIEVYWNFGEDIYSGPGPTTTATDTCNGNQTSKYTCTASETRQCRDTTIAGGSPPMAQKTDVTCIGAKFIVKYDTLP